MLGELQADHGSIMAIVDDSEPPKRLPVELESAKAAILMKPWPKMTEVMAERSRQQARDSFEAYAQYVWPGYKPAIHHKFIITKLERVEHGELTRMMNSWPPQHGKTRTISHLFSCWFLGKHPERRVVCASYGEDRASDTGRDVLRTLRIPSTSKCFRILRLTRPRRVARALTCCRAVDFWPSAAMER